MASYARKDAAASQAMDYLRKHNLYGWFEKQMEEIMILQPDDPLQMLADKATKEITSRGLITVATESKRVEGCVMIKGMITVHGMDGEVREVDVDRTANGNMTSGPRGAMLLRRWGEELGSDVSAALLGARPEKDTNEVTGKGHSQQDANKHDTTPVDESGGPAPKGSVRRPEAGSLLRMEDETVDEAFSRMDKDGSGWISQEELEAALKESGQGDEQVQDIFAKMDLDGNKQVDRQEFHHAMNWKVLHNFGMDPQDVRGLFDGIAGATPGAAVEEGGVKGEVRVRLSMPEGAPREGKGSDLQGRLVELDDYLMAYGLETRIFEGFEGAVTLGEFEEVIVRAVERQQFKSFLVRAGVLDTVIDGLPRGKLGDAQHGIKDSIKSGAGLSVDLLKCLSDAMDKEARGRGPDGAVEESNSKFAELHFGKIEEYYGGLEGQIGAPNPLNVMDVMRKEHCEGADADDDFTTSNYKITTTPRKEWDIVAGEDQSVRDAVNEDGCNGRKVFNVYNFPEDAQELCDKAGLDTCEIAAVHLYTGPMHEKYNCILRNFPLDRVGCCKGNKYTTTIHALVSGIDKLCKVSPVPAGGRVFRGISGMRLPDEFTKKNELGYCGGMEMGFLSTTTRRGTAVTYSSSNDGLGMGIMYAIRVGAIDRPATIDLLSQHPGEQEKLFGPLCYLEPDGAVTIESLGEGGGSVMVVPLRINANKGMTLQDHIERKKKVVMDTWGIKRTELGTSLKKYELTARSNDFFKSKKKFVASISREFEELGNRIRDRRAEDFNDDQVFKASVTEVLEAVEMAGSKMDLGRADADGWNFYQSHSTSLRECHRRQIWDKEKSVKVCKEKATSSSCGDGAEDVLREVRETGLYLCRKKGIVVEGVEEKNEIGESVLTRMAIDNWSNVELVVDAGAKVEEKDKAGKTALDHAVEYHRPEVMGSLVRGLQDVNHVFQEGKTALMIVLAAGLVDVAAYLIDQRQADVHARDERQRSALMYAAEGGHKSTVERLVERGADVNAADEDGYTVLILALKGGHMLIAEMLVDIGADVNAALDNGHTALIFALKGGHTLTAAMLVDRGANVSVVSQPFDGLPFNDRSPLEYAREKGHSGVVALLEGRLEKLGISEHNAALHRAAKDGDAETAAILIDRGANVNAAANNGLTALIRAARGGHTSTAEMLFEKGADVNAAAKDGYTALICALLWGHTLTAEMLVERGADVNAAAKDGYTALICALRWGHTLTAEMLVERGADVKAAAKDGYTALIGAARGGHTSTAAMLVERGSDVNAAAKDGYTALIGAAKGGHMLIAEMLVDRGADVNAAWDNGHNALICAVKGGHTLTAAMLVDRGANVSVVSQPFDGLPFFGKSPLEYAREKGHSGVVAPLEGKLKDLGIL